MPTFFLLVRSNSSPINESVCYIGTFGSLILYAFTKQSAGASDADLLIHVHFWRSPGAENLFLHQRAEATEQRALTIFTRFHANIVCLKPRALLPVIGRVCHTERTSDVGRKKLQDERTTGVPKFTPRRVQDAGSDA